MDEMQENRRLRAAMEGMRYRQGIARTGAFAGSVIAIGMFKFAPEVFVNPWPARIVAICVGSVVTVVAAIPFIKSTCPKCGERYHGLGALLGDAENPKPCKACGFQINRFVSRYSTAP